MLNSNESFTLMTDFPQLQSELEWEKHNDEFRKQNIVIKAKSKKVEYPEHWGGLSIKMVFDGHESYIVDGTEYKLNENTFLVLNHDQYYSSFINEREEATSLTIHFTRRFENDIVNYYNNGGNAPDEFTSTAAHPEFRQTVHHFTKKMKALKLRLNENIKNFEANVQSTEELFYELYVEMLFEQGILIKKQESVDAIKSSTKEDIFKRTMLVKDYIESFYYRPDLNLNELASIACMNRFHLLRCFKQLYGKTPYQYLKKVRFIRAYNLLKSGRYSVSEVVDLCGYDDPSSFQKTFKQTFGVSPSETLSG